MIKDLQLVSIITCTVNSEKYLKECLDSVASQDYPNIEHVVIDGNSDDGTRRILEKYPTIKVYTRNPMGISDAMNYGLEKSSGKIIAHLHSDDRYVNAESVSKAVNAIIESGRKWCVGKIILINSDGSQKVPKNTPYSYRKIFTKNPVGHPAVFIMREVFNSQGAFDTKLKYAMDIDLWLRIGTIYEPVQLFETLTFFRNYGGASTRSLWKSKLEGLRVKRHYCGKDLFLFIEIYFATLKWLASHIIERIRISKDIMHSK